MWTAAVTVSLFLVSACHCQDLLTITSPVEGIEGDTPIVNCTSNTPQVNGTSLFLQVGDAPLNMSRAMEVSVGSNYREFRLRSLNRANFTDLDGPGDNGMPLVCAFQDLKSNISVVSVLALLTITSPVEGAEGDTPIIRCASNTAQITGMSLFLQVGIAPLDNARAMVMAVGSNYREFRLRSLNRANFTDLDGPGDNGMPLVCAFQDQKSKISVVSVFFNDFVALSPVPDVVTDSLVSLVVGQTVTIPLNVSARPVNVAISTAEGVDTPSGIQVVNSELVITDTGRDFGGSYNITVSNPAGVTSTLFDIQVQRHPLFELRDICENRSISTSGSVTEVRCAVNPGDEVRLSCAYDAYPLGTLSVMFNSTDITTSMIENVAVTNNTIVVSNFDLRTHGGTYKCVARNTIRGVAGEATVKFILSEEVTPTSTGTIARPDVLSLCLVLFASYLLRKLL